MEFKRIVASVMVMIFLGGIFSGTFYVNNATAKVKVKSVAVSVQNGGGIKIAKGKSVKLKVAIKTVPNKKIHKKVEFSSKNKKIATVNNKGVVKGKKAGKTKIVVNSEINKKKKATIKVEVFAKAVKRIKLNQSNTILNQGDTYTLKASLSPNKNVCKDVKWTSSKQNIAIVDKKGVVKAVSPGSTVIIAESIDGSKKSAKCKITVQNSPVQQKVDIVSAELIDNQTVNVKLSSVQLLDITSFKLQSKVTAEGVFLKNYSVKGVKSTDMISYELTIDYKNETFVEGQYIKVFIPSLSGVNSIEFKGKLKVMQCGLNETVLTGSVGNELTEKEVYFGRYITGEASYIANGLASGLSLKVRDGRCFIVGTPTNVSDNILASVTATDETGKQASRTVRQLIGSPNVIVTYTKPIYALSNQSCYQDRKIYCSGGSGKCEIQTNIDERLKSLSGVSCSNDGSYLTFKCNDKYDNFTGRNIRPILPAGNYSIHCQITDDYNQSVKVSKDIPLNVSDGTRITGILSDAAGAPIEGEFVRASCINSYAFDYEIINDGIIDERFEFESLYPTNSSGEYTIRVFEGYNYNISGMNTTIYDQPVGVMGALVNLKSSCYKVTIPTVAENVMLYAFKGNDDYLNNDPAYDYSGYYLKIDNEHQTFRVRNGAAYLLPGSYSCRSTSTLYSYDSYGNMLGGYDMSLKFDITNADIIASPVFTDQKKGILNIGSSGNITLAGNAQGYLVFTAPEDGIYKFECDAVCGYIVLEKFDDDLYNESYEKNMKKGEDFMLFIGNTSDYEANITGIKVTKLTETENYND